MRIVPLLLLLGSAAPARASPALGVGVHKTGQALGHDEEGAGEDEERVKMGGGGLHLRWRFAPRLSVELALDRLRSRGDEDGVSREAKAAAVSLAFHPRPEARFDLYLLAGVGRRVDELEVRTPGGMVTAEKKRAQLHVGVGVEKRFRRLGVGAELRLVGLRARDDDDDERTPRVPMPVPVAETDDRERGAQLTIGVTWYFGRR